MHQLSQLLLWLQLLLRDHASLGYPSTPCHQEHQEGRQCLLALVSQWDLESQEPQGHHEDQLLHYLCKSENIIMHITF